jgi:hypothetical protein
MHFVLGINNDIQFSEKGLFTYDVLLFWNRDRERNNLFFLFNDFLCLAYSSRELFLLNSFIIKRLKFKRIYFFYY